MVLPEIDLKLNVNTMASALSVLTAMITPALLLSACGTFILSTTNRLHRAVDRMRELSRQVEELSAIEGEVKFRRERLTLWQEQIRLQGKRLRLLQKALTALYTAALLFVCTSLAIGLTGAVSLALYYIPVLLGILGALCMLVAAITLLYETQTAVQHVYSETDLLLDLAQHHAKEAKTAPRRDLARS